MTSQSYTNKKRHHLTKHFELLLDRRGIEGKGEKGKGIKKHKLEVTK